MCSANITTITILEKLSQHIHHIQTRNHDKDGQGTR